MPAPDRRWTLAYIAAFTLFLTAEISGIRTPGKGRTFTEQTRWAEAHLPGPAKWGTRIVILGLATWAGAHLAEGLS